MAGIDEQQRAYSDLINVPTGLVTDRPGDVSGRDPRTARHSNPL